ncbi:HNH endonuclease signature motif containing protein [Actinomycetospora aeridis]|uniref:DUF222 domain-containing protein n=1 Tax=Actinomycetospora aeridis TaxID=3129231 RepID=A0ABU8MZ40_9PSEU
MFDDGFQVVPAGLEELPAGAGLAAVLEQIDPMRVSPHDTVRLVTAQRRQLAHQQACFHLAAREASLADPSEPGGRAEIDVEAAGDELRVVLSASRTAVARMLDLAEAAERHPRLGAAWRAGLIDEQRVAILVRQTSGLSGEHAAEVIDALVDEAGGLTPSRLIDRAQALAKALDSDWAENLYRKHRRQRRVRARCTGAGTVNLSAMDLPLPGGVAFTRRVNALAARAQAAGRTGLIETIRADVVLAVFHPANAGATDEQIVAAVLAAALPDDPQPRRTPDPAQAPPDEPERASRSGRRPTRQSRFELRVGLATLLQIDDRPARLPGWGVIPAGTARELAAAYCDAEWRVAVTDDTGALTAALITRHRPTHATTTPPEPPVAGAPRPVVELHVTEAALDRLHPGDHPGWAPLLTELQHQLACWRTARAEDRAARESEERAAQEQAAQEQAAREEAAQEQAAQEQAAQEQAAQPRRAPAGGREPLDESGWARVAARRRRRAQEALARFPSAALRRWITMRDRSCVFPPCGASALESEIDHTRSVLEHGLTVGSNLGPACGHDHDLKDQGWFLEQFRPGWFRWTSPTGHTYDRPPRPVIEDLPAPRPFTVSSSAEPHQFAGDGPIWENEPYPPRRPIIGPRATPPRAPHLGGPPPTRPAHCRPPRADDPDPPPF